MTTDKLELCRRRRQKTPANWHNQTLSIIYQLMNKKSAIQPYLKYYLINHYCRKNLGYLFALQQGADCILETDDDNMPFSNFGQNLHREVQGRLVGNSA